MRYRHGIEYALLFVLVLSLALKAANSVAEPVQDPYWVTHRVTQFLEARGFETSRNPSDVDLLSLSATKDDCRFLVAVVSPLGWHRDVIRKITPEGSRSIFVFKSRIYEDQPILRTWVDHYWFRLRRAVGLSPAPSPTIGVVKSPECSVAQSSIWNEFDLSV